MSALLHGGLFLAGEAFSFFSDDAGPVPSGSQRGPFQVYGLETQPSSLVSPAPASSQPSGQKKARSRPQSPAAEPLKEPLPESAEGKSWEQGISFDPLPTPAGLGPSSGGTPDDSRASFPVPSLIQWLDPEYPDTARRRGWEGEVELKFWVNEEGLIEDVQVLSSSRKIFESAALDAARSARFAKAVGILAPSFPELRAFQMKVLFRLTD